MRIAILTRRFNPDGGGTERDLIVTCRYLKEAGHEVEVYVARVRGSSEWLTVRRVPVLPLGRTVELFFFAHLAPVVARRSGAELIISFGRTVDGDVQRCGGGVCRSYLGCFALAGTAWRQLDEAEPLQTTTGLYRTPGILLTSSASYPGRI